jgi:tetratricopeptide (TPR) repeat protein
VEKEELRERYEDTGDEAAFVEAKRLYEQAVAEGADAELLVNYGGLLMRHANFTLRQALAQYERAIELDPSGDKACYQLIMARASLLEPELATDLFKKRLAAAPAEAREYRFLANAYLAGHDYGNALPVIETGLELAPDDDVLTWCRGEVRAGTGDPEGALEDWRQALALNPENLAPVYSRAFLLEREGRLKEAVDAWRFIIEWSEERGFTQDVEWPMQEIERLHGSLPGVPEGLAEGDAADESHGRRIAGDPFSSPC